MADPGTNALAALPAPHATHAASPELWGTMLRSFGMLLVVLAVLVLVLWLLRRYLSNQGAGGQQGLIRMLASMYVAPKERIALVEVMGEKILIGITPQQISFLSRIEDDEGFRDLQTPDATAGFFNALFRRKLRTVPVGTKTKGDPH